MSLRPKFSEDMKAAMRAKNKVRLNTLRLIQTELKRADIAHKTNGKGDAIEEAAILSMLQKMVKQRQETIKIYLENGRGEAASAEAEEIKVIEAYLPQLKSEAETQDLIEALIQQMGAKGMQDMGKVIGALKAAHPGSVDMGLAARLTKDALANQT